MERLLTNTVLKEIVKNGEGIGVKERQIRHHARIWRHAMTDVNEIRREEKAIENSVNALKMMVDSTREMQNSRINLRHVWQKYDWIKEMCVIKLGGARRIGHTQAAIEIIDYIQPERALYLANTLRYSQINFFKRFKDFYHDLIIRTERLYAKTPEYDVYCGSFNNLESFNGIYFDLIIIDNAITLKKPLEINRLLSSHSNNLFLIYLE